MSEGSPNPSPSLNKAKVMLGKVLAMVKGLKKGGQRGRLPPMDPIQKQLRMFLWLMLLTVWSIFGKVSYDLFHPAHQKVVDAGKESHQDTKSLYPWTKGYSYGHDIVEPVVQADRGLAAAIDERELKVTMGARYVEFRDIEAVVKAGMGNHSKVLLSMAFEVDSYPAEQEVLKKELKIREIVTSTLSTRDKDLLTDFRSVAKLKEELLKKLALLISSGTVTDVLITAVASN